MITITAEQIERVNLILSGVPGGIEKALSSTIRRANNTVRSETLKGITTVYAITRQNVRAETTIKVRTQSSDGGIVGTVLFAGHKIPLYRFNVSPTIPIQRATDGRRRCLPGKRAHAVSRRVHCKNAKRTYRYVRARRFKAPAYQRVRGTVYGTDGGKQYRSCRRGGKGTRGHQQAR